MGTRPGDRTGDGVNAGDALAYAVSGGMRLLYGVIAVGWVLRTMGLGLYTASRHTVPRGSQLLLGGPLALVGTAVLAVGSVALAYKLLGDALSA